MFEYNSELTLSFFATALMDQLAALGVSLGTTTQLPSLSPLEKMSWLKRN
jgi:hypothetical protein